MNENGKHLGVCYFFTYYILHNIIVSSDSQHYDSVLISGGARILEQAGPAAGPKVLW